VAFSRASLEIAKVVNLARRRRLVLAHIHLGLACGDSGLGRGENAAVAFAIEDKRDIALMDELVVLDSELVDEAGHIWGYRRHVGLYSGVASLRREHITKDARRSYRAGGDLHALPKRVRVQSTWCLCD
jgi:hypothetical protein